MLVNWYVSVVMRNLRNVIGLISVVDVVISMVIRNSMMNSFCW